ncbi:hypothetical protein EJD97_010441 [Solanum chilense]|uniref:SCP domain-containing protein n=1 Tax=Solanum chilense TaxID=4083 RepID=A0A6N2BNQ0_SOLCI|nr:hypothetical protein EJD97_010441 [Solanum chilense]
MTKISLTPTFLVLSILLIFITFSQATPPTFDWVQQEYLKAHNDLRSSVGVPPLEWDEKLAAYAYDWAVQRKEDCNYRQHSTGPYGENIFWQLYAETPATGIVKKWFDEKKNFDETTTKVGCSGNVYCKNQKGAYVVCSYDPIGNYKGVNPLNPGNNSTSS